MGDSCRSFQGCGIRFLCSVFSLVIITPPNQKCRPMANTGNTITIVGGGVIGLSTAYNIALGNDISNPKVKQKIIVLETGSSVFSSASSHNTGCLHYYFPEEFGKDLTPLGKYSFDVWQSIAQRNSSFINDTGYRPNSLLPIVPGYGRDENALPNCIKNEQQWDINWGSRGNPCATV